MRITYDAVSNMGLRRTNNEDMALVMGQAVRDGADTFSFQQTTPPATFAAVVCDGLGGYEGGEVASEMACDALRDFLDTLPRGLDAQTLIGQIKSWADQTNRAILHAAAGNQMGCTLTGLLLYEDLALLLNAGDSRTYRLRYDTLKQLTTDHSERLRTGDMSIPSSVIYNCLGLNGAFIDITPTRVIAGDRFVICSDGLSDLVDDDTILNTLNDHDAAAQPLVDAALAAGGTDNVTVVTLKFD